MMKMVLMVALLLLLKMLIMGEMKIQIILKEMVQIHLQVVVVFLRLELEYMDEMLHLLVN